VKQYLLCSLDEKAISTLRKNST